MGTTYNVKWVADSKYDSQSLHQEIENTLKEVNRQMSTYIKTSEISKFNQSIANSDFKISPWFAHVLKFSLQLSQDTQGAFDPTIGPLVNLWGFGPSGKKEVPSEDKISEVLKLVGAQKVQVKETNGQFFVRKTQKQVYVDLSASAKGFGVDAISELLNQKSLTNHLVEIGGEMRASGTKLQKPWKVAIEKPSSEGRSIQSVLSLENQAIATSGNYRNFFESGGKVYSHTLDQKTGRPVEHELLSVTVLAKDCMTADGLATGLMAMGPMMAKEYVNTKNIAAMLIIGDKNDVKTQVFESKAFTQRSKP